MSCVFQMRDEKRQLDVILKMPAGLRMATSEQFRWIEREIDVLRLFKHSYAPQLIDHGDDGYGLPWFTVPWIEGPTLDRFLRSSGDETRALELAIELCEVTGALHDTGLIHRDIKPENVMVESDGHVRLIDFGIAGPPGEEGVGARTPPYAPPEQGGEREDFASDVYALGIVLFEMIAGHRVPAKVPRRSDAGDRPQDAWTPRQVSRWMFRHRLYGLRKPFLMRLILRCLEEDPHRRFADATKLGESLRRYLKVRRTRPLWTVLTALALCLGALARLGVFTG